MIEYSKAYEIMMVLSLKHAIGNMLEPESHTGDGAQDGNLPRVINITLPKKAQNMTKQRRLNHVI